jgi:hypothetical protein
MKRDRENVNEQQLEGFLQDLLFQTTSEEEFSLITQMLIDLHDGALIRDEQAASQFEIVKMSPSGTVSVGTIQGIESAQKVLLCLQSTESGSYLIYQRKTGSLTVLVDVDKDPGQDETERSIPFLH